MASVLRLAERLCARSCGAQTEHGQQPPESPTTPARSASRPTRPVECETPEPSPPQVTSTMVNSAVTTVSCARKVPAQQARQQHVVEGDAAADERRCPDTGRRCRRHSAWPVPASSSSEEMNTARSMPSRRASGAAYGRQEAEGEQRQRGQQTRRRAAEAELRLDGPQQRPHAGDGAAHVQRDDEDGQQPDEGRCRGTDAGLELRALRDEELAQAFAPARLMQPDGAHSHFQVLFVNQGKVYEVYARKVAQGRLFGFIEIEELVFGERSTVVLDPGEERIERVRRRHAPAACLGAAIVRSASRA